MERAKKLRLLSFIFVSLFSIIQWSEANALPLLQLDIDGGTYVGGEEESTLVYSPLFTLQALARGVTDVSDEINGNKYITAGQTAYLSIAVEADPKGTSNMTYAGGAVDGVALTGWAYGNAFGDKNQKSHGIFQTLYTEVEFTFSTADFCTECLWNTQDGSATNFDGFIHEFSIDLTDVWSFLVSEEVASYHFDLYTKDADGNIEYFAPFSHDAAATIPEPSTFLLLGSGLLLLACFIRRKKYSYSI
ncbi:MAG: choice-of-anchor N protein [Deltaproteobacteria bacterium]|nr:choice-of-anchor N protein [Deltaproteobacteria bacterium]